MKHLLLFFLIQSASAGLFVPGVPVCAYLAYTHQETYNPVDHKYHWPKWAWIWDNEEDGIAPSWYRAQHPDWSFAKASFHWSALRNSVNNLRFVSGVSSAGRPLWYHTWAWSVPIIHRQAFRGFLDPGMRVTIEQRRFYWKAGWHPNTGWPCLSAGGGRGNVEESAVPQSLPLLIEHPQQASATTPDSRLELQGAHLLTAGPARGAQKTL